MPKKVHPPKLGPTARFLALGTRSSQPGPGPGAVWQTGLTAGCRFQARACPRVYGRARAGTRPGWPGWDSARPSGSGPCGSPGPTLPIRTPNDAFRSRNIILFQYNRNEISFDFAHTRKTFLPYKEDRGESIPRGG